MILVDTSVVIDHLKGAHPKLAPLFQLYPVALCRITRTEVLRGAKNPQDRVRLTTFLDSFIPVAIPDSIWDQVGDNLAALRAAGIAASLPDGAIATLALKHGCELWARDQDFAHMQPVLSALRLFVEPP